MKFFIDTANVDEIREAADLGLVDGVTTNPSLVARENRNFEELIKEISATVDAPVSVEAVSQTAEEIVKEAEKLSKLGDNIVVKIPVIWEGLKATRILSGEGIDVNMTLIFSPMQALLAAKAGAAYVSPFIGRLDDISHVGMELVGDILNIFDNYEMPAEVIVASVRNPLHVLDAALSGAHIATVPFKVLQQFIKHPLTDIGLERFLKDWEKVKQ